MTENRTPVAGDEIYIRAQLAENDPTVTTAWVRIATTGYFAGSLIVEVPKSTVVIPAAVASSPERAAEREKINKITQVLRSEGGMHYDEARSVAESLYLAGVQVGTPEEEQS